MFQIDMKYFRRDGHQVGCGSYASKSQTCEETTREIENLRNGGNLPGLSGRFHDVLVSADVILLGHGVANSLVVIPSHWLVEPAKQAEAPKPPYTPTTEEVLDKATAIRPSAPAKPTRVQLQYLDRNAKDIGAAVYESAYQTWADIDSEIKQMIDSNRLPGRESSNDIAVLASGSVRGAAPSIHIHIIPSAWHYDPAHVPAHSKKADATSHKQESVQRIAHLVSNGIVEAAQRVRSTIGPHGDTGQEHKRSSESVLFLRSAILSNLCLRQYTATGDELSLIQCLIPLFKDSPR